MTAYPFRFWTSFISNIIILLFTYFLWSTLYKDKTIVNGYTLTSVMTYYIVTIAIKKITLARTYARELSRDIKDGNLSLHLLKPFNSNYYRLTTYLGKNLLPISSFILFIIVANTFIPNLLSPSQNFSLFIASTLLGGILNFYIMVIAGSIAFWVVSAYGIINFMSRLFAFLSGSLIPLAFFPEGIKRIMVYSPFTYIHYIPISIYLGNLSSSEIKKSFLIQIIYIFVFFVLSYLIWNKGLKRYDAVNG